MTNFRNILIRNLYNKKKTQIENFSKVEKFNLNLNYSKNQLNNNNNIIDLSSQKLDFINTKDLKVVNNLNTVVKTKKNSDPLYYNYLWFNYLNDSDYSNMKIEYSKLNSDSTDFFKNKNIQNNDNINNVISSNNLYNLSELENLETLKNKQVDISDLSLEQTINLITSFKSNYASNNKIIYRFKKRIHVLSTINDSYKKINLLNKLFINNNNKMESGITDYNNISNEFNNINYLITDSIDKEPSLINKFNLKNFFIKKIQPYTQKHFNHIFKILNSFFKVYSGLISKPLFLFKNNKVIIRIYLCIDKEVGKLNKDIYLKSSLYLSKLNKNRNRYRNRYRNRIRYVPMFRKPLKFNLLHLIEKKLYALSFCLSKLINKKVEIEIIQLHYPFLESNILSQFLAINAFNYKFSKFKKLFRKMKIFKPNWKNLLNRPNILSWNNASGLSKSSINFNTNNNNKVNKEIKNKFVPTYSISNNTGIRFKLGGRLLTERVIPRKTVRFAQKGSFNRGVVDFVSGSRFTIKNNRNTFSISSQCSYKLKNNVKN